MMANNLVLVGSEGDIFWDLPALITYVAGSELGCTIYIANPTDEVKEYCLMARLFSPEGEVILEESIPVHGFAWFIVDPNDFIKLHGALAFDVTNVTLLVELIERVSDTVVNTVSTYLVAPTAAQWPPGWPGAPTLPGGLDWTSLMMMIMFMIMMVVMVKGISPEKEKGYIPYEETKVLPI